MEAPPPGQQTFSTHYRRLQEIEQKVVRAIEAASYVMTELSKNKEEMDKSILHVAATGFVQQVQEAQQLVLQAVKSAAPERNFEANNYFAMVQSMVAAEKLDAVSVHVSGISKLLRQQRQQQQQQLQAAAAAAAADGHGELTEAAATAAEMLVDDQADQAPAQ
ncbi:hypothetical protein OEZ86_000273 [Tetradesmus obliquus]|uniref:Mediator of RNA polymerase II transcription subunit 11 n=1 Tax=Tetradesmus obliquus TaxID=3088 RepID=A0ABY8TLX0_TETOB|nr:hypothetical protein OEZ85_010315 [Tetradesmus obliquus]WIA30181.1 hypothetical protein OEZ86_000273 [Tetradesmus obliquus]